MRRGNTYTLNTGGGSETMVFLYCNPFRSRNIPCKCILFIHNVARTRITIVESIINE